MSSLVASLCPERLATGRFPEGWQSFACGIAASVLGTVSLCVPSRGTPNTPGHFCSAGGSLLGGLSAALSGSPTPVARRGRWLLSPSAGLQACPPPAGHPSHSGEIWRPRRTIPAPKPGVTHPSMTLACYAELGGAYLHLVERP